MKYLYKVNILIAIMLVFSSISLEAVNQNNKVLSLKGGQPLPSQNIKMHGTMGTITKLCSDEFQGRKIGSMGNEKAGEYIAKIFKDIGLDALFGNIFFEKYSQKFYEGKVSIRPAKNIIGFIKGKNIKKAVIISAHFDHLGIKNGRIYRGALDNASGLSALIEIAQLLKEKSKIKSFETNIIFCAFNGEESFRGGSQAFIKDIKSNRRLKYNELYNLNIDCIGAKDGGKLALVNKSRISNKLFNAFRNTLLKHHIDFESERIHGISDNLSFEVAKIPNIEIQQDAVRPLIHNVSDTPEIIDPSQIDKIANAVCDFIYTNDGLTF